MSEESNKGVRACDTNTAPGAAGGGPHRKSLRDTGLGACRIDWRAGQPTARERAPRGIDFCAPMRAEARPPASAPDWKWNCVEPDTKKKN